MRALAVVLSVLSVILSIVLLGQPELSAQVTTIPPPAGFVGGTVAAPVLGSTGCTTPPFSFAADTDAGLCLSAANTLTAQTAASGNSRSYVTLGAADAVISSANGAGSIASILLTGGTAIGFDVAASTPAVQFTATLARFGYNGTYDTIEISPVAKGASSFAGTITSVDLTLTPTWTLPNFSGDFNVVSGGSIASAATIDLLGSSVAHITGTTTITSVTLGRAGRCVSLIFDGVLTFTDGSNLKLAGNFVTTADDTISLCSDGTNWYERARAIN